MIVKACRTAANGLVSACADPRIFNLFAAVVIGVLGGYGAVFFRFVIKYTQYAFYRHTGDVLEFSSGLPAYLFVLMPVLGGLIVGLLVRFGAREAKGHGVPEVMEAVVLRSGHIRKRVAAVKIAASAVCIGSGGSVGREGPIVQIGSSIGSTVAQIFRLTRDHQRTMVGCGAAAGIAATFNAPVAGVLFSVEILMGEMGLATFSPIILSSVTATTISRYYFGDFPAFIIPEYSLVSLWEILIYPFLGLLAGLVGLLFITALYKSEDLFDAVRAPEWLKPAAGGAMIGVLFLKWPHVFGVGYGAINLSLMNQMTAGLLLTLVLVKITATSITIGSGGSGGIFAPSLFIGAMTGGFFGHVVNLVFPTITAAPGAYALVCMGALVAGTTHAPITAILIIFELTGDYKIILPLMLSCIIATILASSLNKGSIYTIKLLRRGVDIAGGRDQNILRRLRVRQFMNKDIITIPESARLFQILSTFHTTDASYLHVINEHGELTGVISFRDIRGALGEDSLKDLIIAKDVATPRPVTVTPDDNILKALRIMSEHRISQVPVVEPAYGNKVVGALSEKTVISAYDKSVLRREYEADIEERRV